MCLVLDIIDKKFYYQELFFIQREKVLKKDNEHYFWTLVIMSGC